MGAGRLRVAHGIGLATGREDDTRQRGAMPHATWGGTYSMSTSHLPLPPAAAPPMMVPPSRSALSTDLGFAEQEGGLDWNRVLSAVLRFKWLIVAVTVVGTAAGVAATRFLSAAYVAQATIWIDQPDQRNGPDRGPIRPGQLLQPEAWVDLLKSYVVLDHVVRDQRMFVAPKSLADASVLERFGGAGPYRRGAYGLTVDGTGRRYTLATDDGIELGHGALGDSVGVRLGFLWAPSAGTIAPGRTIEFSLATLRDSARHLADAIEVRTAENGNLLRMELQGDRPEGITAVVNAIAERYVALAAEALAVVGSVQQNADLAAALKELNSKQADLRTLRYRYSDQYPPVQRLQGEIATLKRQTIPTLARGLSGELAARDAELSRRLDTDSRNLRAIPPRAIEEARLRRGVTLGENLYTTLQSRFEEARLAEASTVPDVRILDHAVVPQRPVRNTAPRVIMLGFVASLGLGLFGAVVLDRIDPRVRYPDQVSREMGLAILGAVPHLRTLPRAGRHGRGGVPEDVNQVVGALRGVCLNLVYAHGGRAPLLVTVTSPGAGDGKSFLAANLAHTFADGGHRALLIDADIRRGVLHRRLNARRRPGLSDFLRGETPLDSIVQATPYPSLSLIGCGTRAYNAPELLGSPPMSELVNGMRSGYDVILIDSPPLAAGVAPLILGTLTGTLVLVLRTGYSHRDVAAAKLEVLQRLPVRLLGAILNDVPAGGAYRCDSSCLR